MENKRSEWLLCYRICRFKLHLKLCVVMGCTWVFELVSWALPLPQQYCWLWYFTDLLNMLQGLWIFLIFVAKPSIYRKLVKRQSGSLLNLARFLKLFIFLLLPFLGYIRAFLS